MERNCTSEISRFTISWAVDAIDHPVSEMKQLLKVVKNSFPEKDP